MRSDRPRDIATGRHLDDRVISRPGTADQARKLLCLLSERLRRSRRLFDHRSVLLRHLIHLVDGRVDLLQATGLFVGAPVTMLLISPRLEGREYDVIRFRNGYGPDVPEMDVEWKGVEKQPDCYAIRLGKILSLKRWRE
jgi:hypothetical protein